MTNHHNFEIDLKLLAEVINQYFAYAIEKGVGETETANITKLTALSKVFIEMKKCEATQQPRKRNPETNESDDFIGASLEVRLKGYVPSQAEVKAFEKRLKLYMVRLERG